MRVALCFVGFLAIDAALIFLMISMRDDQASDLTKRERVASPQIPQLDFVRSTETVHEASTLLDDLKCSGGLVYRTAIVNEVKEITVLMDSGKPVRCK